MIWRKISRQLVLALAVLCAMHAVASLARADPDYSDTYPWVNVNAHFGAAVRGGRILPVQGSPAWAEQPKGGAAWFFGSDVAGWQRSLDGGRTYENANSGRVFSTQVCGGFVGDWFTQDEKDAGYAQCTSVDPGLTRAWAEGGPPSALAGYSGLFSNANDMAAGPRPTGFAGAEIDALCRGPGLEHACAESVLYSAVGLGAFFSPDIGRSWFPLTPHCQVGLGPWFHSIAVDAGQPGHVVALAREDTAPQTEASGCSELYGDPPKPCRLRAVAWTTDVAGELREAMLSSQIVAPVVTEPEGKKKTSRAGGGGAAGDPNAETGQAGWAALAKWRYGTIGNLPAPAAIGGTCRVHPLAQFTSADNAQASIVGPSCGAPTTTRCHGRKSASFKDAQNVVADRDAWCLDYTSAACQCTTGPSSTCRYPTATYIDIDPRNGWAYLSTDVGLLTSPDGGGHWIRQGGSPASNPADALPVWHSGAYSVAPPPAPSGSYVFDNATTGARLYTKQFTPNSATGPAELPGAIDLNAEPARIQFVGRVSMAFTACPSGATYTGSTRKRGHMVAAVPVEWIAPNGYRVSGVFVAAERVNCDPAVSVAVPKALSFWDSAHQKLKLMPGQTLPDDPAEQPGAEALGHPANLDSTDFEFKEREYFSRYRHPVHQLSAGPSPLRADRHPGFGPARPRRRAPGPRLRDIRPNPRRNRQLLLRHPQ